MTSTTTASTTTTAGPDRVRLPRLVAPGDPVVCRLWMLRWIATLCAVGCGVALLLASGGAQVWWKWVIVAVLVLPAVVPGVVLAAVALADFCLLWVVLWPGLGLGLSVGAFGLHTGAVGWLLAGSLPGITRVHRSALRTIVLRWGWIQVATQIAAILASLTAELSDPLFAGAGLLAAVAIVLAIAYWGLAPGRDRDRPRT